MKFYINVTEQRRCRMLTLDNELVDDYTSAHAFETREKAQDYIDFWVDDLPFLSEATIEIHDNWYIFWVDGVNSGFVDYSEDFVTDNLEERAMWFETKEDTEEYIEKIKEKNPNCCNLEAVEYIDE